MKEKLIEMAKQIKKHCQDNECGDCPFSNLEGCYCELMFDYPHNWELD